MSHVLDRLMRPLRPLLPAAAIIALAAPAPAALLYDQRFDNWDDEHRGGDVGDVNGDGHVDIVTSNFRTGRILVRLGDGAGGFTASLGPAVGERPIGVRLGDMDGDGDLDTVVVNYVSNSVAVCFNDGSGTFDAPTSYPIFAPHSLDLGDIDGDGHLDVAVSDDGSGFVWLLMNDGEGGLTGKTEVFIGPDEPAGGLALADLDGDDDIDLAVTLRNNGDTLVALNQNGQLVPDVVYETSGVTVAVGDIDGDQLPDIVVPGGLLLHNVGNGEFVSGPSGPTGGSDVTLADFDGDGDLDAAFAATFGIQVASNNGSGTFQINAWLSTQLAIERTSWSLFTHTTTCWLIFSDDIDQDGAVDLLAVSSGSRAPNSSDFIGYVSVFKNDGDGDFGGTSTVWVGGSSAFEGGPSHVVLSDLDGDGALDVVVTNPVADELTVVMNDVLADPDFPHPSYPVGPGPERVAIVDLDGDQLDDAVVANYLDASVSVLMGIGDAMFGDETRIGTFILPTDVAIGDLDDDGRPDVVLGHQVGASITVLRNAGGGALDAPVLIDTGLTSTNAIALRDMDDDGALDIVVASPGVAWNGEPGTVAVLRNAGDLVFTPITTATVGLNAIDVVAEDFDGNGRPDVATLDKDDGTVSMLPNLGGGVLGSVETHPVVTGAQYFVAADPDMDDDVDLVIANGDFTFSVLVNEGGAFDRNDHIPSRPNESLYATLWRAGSLAVGDVSGDQRPDVVLTDAYIEQIVVTKNLSDVTLPPECEGDLNESGHVGFDDLTVLLNAWGACTGGCVADLNDDGSVGFADLQMLLQAWGPC